MERLARIPYSAMLGFLKQSSLVDLANQGAGSTKLPTTASVTSETLPKPPPRTLNFNDVTPTGAASVSGFAGIFAASADGDQTSDDGRAAGQEADKTRGKWKGKKGKKGKG
jgi:hypothetical protein